MVIPRVILKSLFNLVGLIISTLWKCATLLIGTHMNAGIGTKIAQGALPDLQQALNTQRLEVQFKFIVVALVSRKERGLTQAGVFLNAKFVFGVILTDVSKVFLSLKVPL